MMHILTNFNCQQFSELYRSIEPHMLRIHSGGRISKITTKTMFMIALCFCKHALSFRYLQEQFGLSSSYLERIIFSTISACHVPLFHIFVKWVTHEENERDQTLFENFPYSMCAVVASVQEITREKNSQNIWYSGKHKKHCIKIQAAVGPKGLLIDLRGPVPGSVHDFSLLQNSGLVSKLISERNRFMD